MAFSFKPNCTAIPFVGVSTPRIRLLLLSFGFFSLFYLYTVSNEYSIKNVITHVQQYPVWISNSIESVLDDSDAVPNRSFCCLTSDGGKDICGRENCTWPCPSPARSIPQLDDMEPNSREGNNAFFVETSGGGALNIRQACAVESIAYQNPDLSVFVLFIDTEINANSTVAVQLAGQYKNVHLISVKMDDYLAGTPLEHWYHCTDWRKGPYHVSHMSDGLRFLTIAKYGGYYFDLDMIQIRPVTFLRNFVSAESQDLIASCAFHADYGSSVMQMAANEFPRDYRGDVWTHNGPDLLVRVMKKWCHAENLSSMGLVRCKGFHLLPTSSFNPIHYGGIHQMFENRPANETGDPPMVSEDVIGIHIFNKISFNRPVYKNSTQYYTRLARSYCPFSLTIAPDVF